MGERHSLLEIWNLGWLVVFFNWESLEVDRYPPLAD